MIDALVAAALVGTAREPRPLRSTGSPLDALLDARADRSPEQALLLAAGAAGVYRRAGMLPETCGVRLPICPPETRPELGRRGSDLLADLLHGRQPIAEWSWSSAGNRAVLSPAELVALLPEAFRLVEANGRRLPHALLPPALDLTAVPARAALPPILGERGRWLAKLNPRWGWAADTPSGFPPDDADSAERFWQEGTPAQRRTLLGLLRAVAPDTARQWLADSWKGEKPDSRRDLLSGLATGLTAVDEPFLEQALRDSSGESA